ncbi:ORC ubiquitin ligase 1 [Thalassophryne amazonica]|uniref:ORC ubiquitin ligase 1 n=1 Tax=Thalassophryne amazonica TaxID=390379 RepID=UPI0014719B7D|nr:ORC ubiquitin ligase 1 [Thalassophryne amazonica]
MALNIQTPRVSLTLPISCQICLGKVRQPVICTNNHVFCSLCMETWLKKAEQCPTCRVAITPENPCREIIGGSSESDHSHSPSTKKYLRKTRVESLLQEYEEEIDGLIRENEDLKTKNLSLKTELKTALDSCTINAVQTEDKKADLDKQENKLQAATDVWNEVMQKMDKIKEVNKVLRSQNVDLVQENMRLKAEVASRSPQKFGRYTVAALEAKIQQYERNVDQLKRALERSDQYIEDLESQIRRCEMSCAEMQEMWGKGSSDSEALTEQQRINMMKRSLSDNERKSICSNPEAASLSLPRSLSLTVKSSTELSDHSKFVNLKWKLKNEHLDSATSDLLPSTPSSAFRSLTLKSPSICTKKVALKPAPHLRRLDFEGLPCSSVTDTENQFTGLSKFINGLHSNLDSPKSVIWGAWQRTSFKMQSCADPNEENPVTGSNTVVEPDGFQFSSEASMDAAYRDKISELDSMMLDGESSSSHGSQLSSSFSPLTDLDTTLIPESQSCSDVTTDCCDSLATGCCEQKHSPSGLMGGVVDDTEAPNDSAEEGFAPPLSGTCNTLVPNCSGTAGPSHAEELSFDLLFDPLEECKDGPCGSLSPASQHQEHEDPSSSARRSDNTRDGHTVNISQLAKRKFLSPFHTNSPLKLSKFM